MTNKLRKRFWCIPPIKRMTLKLFTIVKRTLISCLMHTLISKRKLRFLIKYKTLDNYICNLCTASAELEIDDIIANIAVNSG